MKHPRHLKRNIPYNLALTICTIVDNIETKNTRLEELEDVLSKRGNPKEITIGIYIARALNQNLIKTPQVTQATGNILTFVTTFNPNNLSIISLLQKSLAMLKSSPKMKSALEWIKIIDSRGQSPNLKQLLIKSKFPNRKEGIVSKCACKRCVRCELLMVGNLFHLKSSNYPFKVKHDMDCMQQQVFLMCAEMWKRSSYVKGWFFTDNISGIANIVYYRSVHTLRNAHERKKQIYCFSFL